MKKIVLNIILLIIVVNVQAQKSVDFCNDITSNTREIATKIQKVSKPLPPISPEVGPHLEIDRKIFWVHGYGGTGESWTLPAELTENIIPSNTYNESINTLTGYDARRVENFFPSYGSGLSLKNYGIQVRNQIKDAVGIDEDEEVYKENFVIAHSFGGLVTRSAEQNGNPNHIPFMADGIVTFGTPHHGAVLADNVVRETEDGKLETTEKFDSFVSYMANSLIAGPLSEGIKNDFALNLLIENIYGKVQEFIDISIKKLVPKFLSSTGFFNKTALELQTTSDAIKNLDVNYTHNAYTYGVEDRDLALWRVLYWAQNNCQAPPNKTTLYEGYFEAGGKVEGRKDHYAIKYYEENLGKYQAKYNLWKITELNEALATNSSVLFWNFLQHYNAMLAARNRKIAWYKGVNWFQLSTRKWELLTGASSFGPNLNKCECRVFDPEIGHSFFEEVDCATASNYSICRHPIENIYKPNDGIVLAESAVDFPNAFYLGKMKGSNHFQMRNDWNTRDRLLDVFNVGGPLETRFFDTKKQ